MANLDYTLQTRNRKTLAVLGQMPYYESAWWHRRGVTSGQFEVTLHRDQIDVDLIPHLCAFEVRRGGDYEFGGIMERREYDALTKTWTLGGRDLKGYWLSGREINPGASEFDAQTGVPAETAMKHYVRDHLTEPSDSDRDVNGELTAPIDFTCEGTHGWGGTVNYNGRWQRLNAVLTELAHKGDLLHDVVMKRGYTGYEYRVTQPVDATEDSGATPVVFSVEQDNVSEAVYVENSTSRVNALYVLGQGQGASRTVRERTDAPSIAADGRREGHLDARGSDSNDKLDQQGDVAIAQSLLDALTARMTPLNLDPTLYRREWDLGHVVTVAFTDIGVTLDRRIEGVKVVLGASRRA